MDDTFQESVLPVDREALLALLIRRSGELRRHVAKKIPLALRHKIAADDVLQEVWVVAFQELPKVTLKGEAALDCWLMSIANCKLVNALRKAWSDKRGGNCREVREGEGQSSSYLGLFSQIASPDRTPSGQTAMKEAVLAVQVAMSSLPKSHRRAIYMYYIEGRQAGEVAILMKKTENAVRGLLFRGLREMRRRLGNARKYLSDAGSIEDEGDSS